MHSTETINQFLNLRVQGWSFARIADHLRVSKPTLLDWNRKYQLRLASMKVKQEHSVQQTVQVAEQSELQDLAMFYNALRRELVSRTLKEFSSDEIQALACDINQQIDNLTRQEPVLSSVALLPKGGPAQSDPVQPNPATPPPPGKETGKEMVNFLAIFDHLRGCSASPSFSYLSCSSSCSVWSGAFFHLLDIAIPFKNTFAPYG
jgi:hypothetical protein